MTETRTVLVTGASSGIGRAASALFAARGWNVAATMRQPDASQFDVGAPQLRVLRLDVTDEDSIAAAVAETLADFGRIDALVNNAGYGLIGAFEAMTAAEVKREIDTNLVGLMNVTRAVLPAMRRQASGCIINVGSVAGQIGFPLYSLYCATKFAVEGFSESLDYELRHLGIRVKVIEPGAIKTEFFGRSLAMPATGRVPAVDAYSARVFANIKAKCQDPPGPEIVARSIYRAATSRNPWRMRFAPNGRALLLGRRFTPAPLHRAIVRFLLGA